MHDIVSNTDKLKGDALSLHLGPERWNSFTTKVPLEWTSVRWVKTQKKEVPNVRGIYAFTVEFTNQRLPRHGYVLYIGITGDGKSNATLRTRFGDYFREKYTGRVRIEYMLNKWGDHLTFQFAEIKDRRYKLSMLEKQLCDAIIPHASRNDLTANVRKWKEAAGL